jgi:hypothetical protein
MCPAAAPPISKITVQVARILNRANLKAAGSADAFTVVVDRDILLYT